MGSQGYLLAARLDCPSRKIKAYAVFAPCFTCTKDMHAPVRIGAALAQRGIATLRLDFTGLGDSEGNFTDTHFSTYINDLLASIRYLESRNQTPSLLMGHSLGGTAALFAAARSSPIKAVVTLNSPFQPRHVARHFTGNRDELQINGEADVQIGSRTFRIKQTFFEDLEKHRMEDILPHLRAALLVLHAGEDDMVHIRNGIDLFKAAPHPKSFIGLRNVDHLISGRSHATYVAELIATWFKPYL